MQAEQLAGFKRQLVELQQELLTQEKLLQSEAKPVELDQSKVGRLSRMDAMQTQQIAVETARRNQQQLARISIALKKIDSEDYGYCDACDEEIDIRRLAIDPTHLYCIDCAEKLDNS